ncbi:MAG: Fic family protein, partial [Nanoarchaeota archaeon]|nr:Fic family protein [Nanoarchaeota archaeon]
MVLKTITAVDAILGRINVHPEYSCNVRKQAYQAFRDESISHSLSLEIESLTNGSASAEVRTKEGYRKLRRNLDQAMSFLSEEGLTLYSLSQLGHKIDPEKHSRPNFRNSLVKFGKFVPCNSDDVIYHIKSLVDFLKYTPVHPITRATEAHISMIQIHPYEDGNGRAARLLQNFCLSERGYPLAIIPIEDRELYIDLMNGTLDDRFSGKSSLEIPSTHELSLHKYLATRVLSSTKRLEHELRGRRMYEISAPQKTHKAQMMTLASMIKGYNRRKTDREGVTAKFDNKSSKRRKKLAVI